MIKKVIFHDGNLSDLPIEFLTKYLFIYAKRGYTLNQEKLAEMSNKASKFSIITNDLFVWGNDIAWWNDKENKCQAYILKEVNGKWTEINIQDLTEKELRKPHNIVKMYTAGAFYKEMK